MTIKKQVKVGIVSGNISFDDLDKLILKKKENKRLDSINNNEQNIQNNITLKQDINQNKVIKNEQQFNITEQQISNNDSQQNNLNKENIILGNKDNDENQEKTSKKDFFQEETKQTSQENIQQQISQINTEQISEQSISSPTIDIDSMLGNLDSKTLGAEIKQINQENNKQISSQTNISNLSNISGPSINDKTLNFRKIIFWVVFVLGVFGGIFYIYTTRPMLLDDIKKSFNSLQDQSTGMIKTPLADKIEQVKEEGLNNDLEEDLVQNNNDIKEDTDIKTGQNILNENSNEGQDDVIDQTGGNDITGEDQLLAIDKEIDKELGLSGNILEQDSQKSDFQDQIDANKIVLQTLQSDTDILLEDVLKSNNKKLLRQTSVLKSKIEEILTGLDKSNDIDLDVLNRSVSDLQILFDKIKKKLKETN